MAYAAPEAPPHPGRHGRRSLTAGTSRIDRPSLRRRRRSRSSRGSCGALTARSRSTAGRSGGRARWCSSSCRTCSARLLERGWCRRTGAAVTERPALAMRTGRSMSNLVRSVEPTGSRCSCWRSPGTGSTPGGPPRCDRQAPCSPSRGRRVGVAGTATVDAVVGQGGACCAEGDAADHRGRRDRVADLPAHGGFLRRWSGSERGGSGTGSGLASRRAARDATLGYAFPAFGCSAGISGSSAGAIIEGEVSR